MKGDMVAGKKKKRRGKRGVRKGKKQVRTVLMLWRMNRTNSHMYSKRVHALLALVEKPSSFCLDKKIMEASHGKSIYILSVVCQDSVGDR